MARSLRDLLTNKKIGSNAVDYENKRALKIVAIMCLLGGLVFLVVSVMLPASIIESSYWLGMSVGLAILTIVGVLALRTSLDE